MAVTVHGADGEQWPSYTPDEVACSIGMFSLFGSLATWVKSYGPFDGCLADNAV